MAEQPLPIWKRFFMWDFPRGSVAYDVKVGLILAFIFLTPAWVFHDEPQLAKARGQVVMLPDGGAETRFWLEPDWAKETFGLQAGEAVSLSPSNGDRLSESLSNYSGKPRQLVRVETLRSPEGNVQGFVAVTRP